MVMNEKLTSSFDWVFTVTWEWVVSKGDIILESFRIEERKNIETRFFEILVNFEGTNDWMCIIEHNKAQINSWLKYFIVDFIELMIWWNYKIS